MKTITSLNVFVILFCLPVLAPPEMINPEILRQLQQLDGGYKSRWYQEAMLYRTSFQQTLYEIHQALGEQRCYSDQVIIADLIAEFHINNTSMERILEMNNEVGFAIARCWSK